MSKTFTCCELVKRIREHQEASTTNWSEKDKYIANEFLWKASWKITNKRIKKWINSEPVWTSDTDHLFCEECENWFREQGEKQLELIDAQIEKEKADGTFYSNPKTKKALEEIKAKADKYKKELESNGQQNLPFGKSPQE